MRGTIPTEIIPHYGTGKMFVNIIQHTGTGILKYCRLYCNMVQSQCTGMWQQRAK